MVFEDFSSAQSVFLWATFAVALVMGAVANKTNFCTMGAVSDAVNMGDMGRMRTWFLAIAVAMAGVVIFEATGTLSVDSTFPPYRGSQLIWLENLLGGVLFGIGMTFASGCGNKTLVRAGAGNIKSIFVLVVIAIIAYYMTSPFPDSDKTLYSVLFYDWINPTSISLVGGQDLGSLINVANGKNINLILGAVISFILLIFIFKCSDFRSNSDNILGGLVIGLAVLAGWYISSAFISINADDEMMSIFGYMENWDMLADSDEGKPASARSLATQSFTFINPVGQSFGYAANGFAASYLTFGLMAVFGVISGSFVWAILSRGFRIEWFASFGDFITHMIGATLMGFGGVLAVGCTIGQGITGVSTLALGSIITLVAIIFGCAMTMKIQLYKMMYDDASFFAAFITGLVDLHLLPKGMRKLEAI